MTLQQADTILESKYRLQCSIAEGCQTGVSGRPAAYALRGNHDQEV